VIQERGFAAAQESRDDRDRQAFIAHCLAPFALSSTKDHL
jgi:hypothetical protein